MNIEIYERKNNKIVETKQVENLKGFLSYWVLQCDDKRFGWRIKNDGFISYKRLQDGLDYLKRRRKK